MLKNIRSAYIHLSQAARSAIAGILGCAIVLALNTSSQAHWADLSVADIQIQNQDVSMNLTVPTGLLQQFDDDRNKQLSDGEITKHQKDLQIFFNEKIRFTAGNEKSETLKIEPAAAKKIPTNLVATPDTHSTLFLKYRWAQPIDHLQLYYDLFLPNVNTAQCLVQVFHNGRSDNLVLTPSSNNVSLIDAPIFQQINSFIRLGIEHIWTGYDHILFLISLLMLGGNLGYLIKVVTAFSLSHSITLALAVLNIVSVPSRWVEIIIALSIGYIAAENLWRKEPNPTRWQWTFGFGLIHGLGFSSALQELALPQNNLVVSLASFSAGIEIGQISIVLFTYFCLNYLRKFPWDLTIRRLISGGVIVMSVVWFWERAVMGL